MDTEYGSQPNMDNMRRTMTARGPNAPLFTKRNAQLDMLSMFPSAFTMVSILLYTVPVWIVISVGQASAVNYFNSNWFYVIIIIPGVTMVVHVIHERKKAP